MGLMVQNSIASQVPIPILNRFMKSKDGVTGFDHEARYVSRQVIRQSDTSGAGKNGACAAGGEETDIGCGVDSCPLTPSLSRVMHQIKHANRMRRDTESTLDSSSERSLNSVRSASSMFGPHNDEALSDSASDQNVAQQLHPLSSLNIDTESVKEKSQNGFNELPYAKMYNPGDLHLVDAFTKEDILQKIKPIYTRPRLNLEPMDVNRILSTTSEYSDNSARRRSLTPIFLQDKVVEMEHWPQTDAKVLETRNNASFETVSNPRASVIPPDVRSGCPDPSLHKRTRQRSLNSSFLRLYAVETTMKRKHLLPDLNLDQSILQRLSIAEIAQLNIPIDGSTGITAEQIKLALITRKKLWSDMCQVTRTDLHGEYAPSNLRFVRSTQPALKHEQQEATSLVRLNSEVKPWSQPEMSQGTMFKPCGKISTGRSIRSKEIQYVVKGWCDYRFA